MLTGMLPAQARFEYIVTVVGSSNAKMPNVKVWLQETQTGTRIVKYTDQSGKVTFNPAAGYWTLNLEGLHNYTEFELAENEEGRGSVTIHYDLAQIRAEQDFLEKRKNTTFKTFVQNRKVPPYPPKDSCILKVKLQHHNDRPVEGIPVSVVSVQHQLIISSVSGRNGEVAFMVPIGGLYAVDVGEAKNFSFSGQMVREGVMTLGLTYEPTLISEKNVNDTITQIVTRETRATSARSLFELTVLDENGSKAANENVYLHEVGSNRVFKTKTGFDGKAVFLIPNGSSYLLHFDYLRDVDVFSFKTVKGIGNSSAQLHYIPDPRLKHPEMYIPKPDELFFVDFQNFINRQLPEPEKKVQAFNRWGNNKVNRKSKYAVLEIGISVTRNKDKIRNESEMDLCFVIDRSGSMAGYNRIESLKESMLKFIDEMHPRDRAALVSFNHHAFVDVPMQPLGSKEIMRNAIRDLEPGGLTHIYNGMLLGYNELLKSEDSDRMRHLILLSDGYGSDEPKQVVDLSKEHVRKGIGISAIGVGEDYNAALLTLLAAESGGLMEHAGQSDMIYEAFSNQMSNLLYPVGRDASLTIHHNSQIKLRYVHGLPFRDQKNYTTTCDIGKLFIGQDKIALVQFDLDNPGKEIENMPVIVELSYYDLAEKQVVTYSYEARLIWSDEDPQLDVVSDQEQRKIFAIAVINQSMKVMADAFAQNNPAEARHAIERGIAQIMELYPGARENEVEKLLAQMSNYLLALENFERKQRIEGQNSGKIVRP